MKKGFIIVLLVLFISGNCYCGDPNFTDNSFYNSQRSVLLFGTVEGTNNTARIPVGSDGTPTSIQFESSFAIESGKLTGEVERIIFYNDEVRANNYEPIIPTSQTQWKVLTSQQKLTVGAWSIDDDSVGTGARTVYIEGVDDNYALTYETVVLSGEGAVPTVNEYLNVNEFYSLTAGSLGINQGHIFLHADGIAGERQIWPLYTQVVSSIMTEEGAAQYGRYVIPAGKTGYLKSYTLVSGEDSSTAKTQMRIRFGAGSDQSFASYLTLLMYRNSISHDLGYKDIPEKSCIEIWGAGEGGLGSVSGVLTLILMDNE